MYTSSVREYRINLRLPEKERWNEVIRAERRLLRRVARTVIKDYAAYPGFVRWAAAALFKAGYQAWGGRYVGEIESLAEACGVSAGELTIGGCQYELTHALDPRGDGFLARVRSLFACTAGVRQLAGLGPTHVRSMDWEVPIIGEATRLFRFHDRDREFVSVGILGHVGVLSGMVPGAYSVTINWAPPVGRPTMEWGPAFLLREVLETCDTYDEAVKVLRDTELSTSVFFVVCGSEDGQACVIERTADQASVRRMRGPVISQANHHESRRFRANNERISEPEDDGVSFLADSKARARTLERSLSALPSTAQIGDAAACLDEEPVCNADSYQQMVFAPRTGEVRVWRWAPSGR